MSITDEKEWKSRLITPDKAGYCSLGQAMEQAPRTLGDTFVHIDDFDYLVQSTEPPIYFQRWPVYEVYESMLQAFESA